MGKRQKWMITIGCFFSYFLFGAVDNMKGSVLPVLLQDVGFDHSLGGMIISSEYTGFFLATFLAGLIADRFGKRVTLIMAGLSLSLKDGLLTAELADGAGETDTLLLSLRGGGGAAG